jgi:hypothetical protein
MVNTRFGNIEGGLSASGLTLFKRAAWMWAIYLFVAAMIGVFVYLEEWASAVVLGVTLFIGSIFIIPVFQAIELRWWLEGIRFGPVTVESDLPSAPC